MFSFWGFSPKSPQLTFFFWGILRADFQSSLPKAFRCSFSDLPFGCFSFVIFSEWVDSFLLSWKILSHLPSWFTFLRSPTYQASFYQVLIPKSLAFFWAIGGWWDMSIFVLCVHEHAPLSCQSPRWSFPAFLEEPMVLAVLRYLGLVPF